jgi:hypothetical protein
LWCGLERPMWCHSWRIVSLLMAVEARWYLAIAALLVTMGVRGLMV